MLHDPGGLVTQEPGGIHKLDNYYSDSNNTSSSSSSAELLSKLLPPRVTTERKPSATTTPTTMTAHTHRRSSDRAKDLHRLNAPQLIDLVLRLESQLDKSDTKLKKYVSRCKEHADSETRTSEQANKFRQKMTQVILDAQQDAARARQDVEEYKLRFENVQRELQRSREIVQILETDKDNIQRAFQHAREQAREYKERSAVQLAREQGRRAGFEQGLEQGRLAVQLAHVRATSALVSVPTNTTSTTPRTRSAPRRRALTQGTDGATTAPTTAPTTPTRRRHRRSQQPQSRTRPDSLPSQRGRRPSLDSIREAQREEQEQPILSRPPSFRSRPPSQAQTDGGRSNASGPREQDPTYRPSTTSRSNNGPVQPIPPIPPPQQFPGGPPRDDVSEATTSPASTMAGMEILTFPESRVVSTSPTSSPESRRSRRGRANTTSVEDGVRAGHPPARTAPPPAPVLPPPAPSFTQRIPHSDTPGITVVPPPSNPTTHPAQPPPVVFPPPDENLLTPTFLPASNPLHRSTSTNSFPNTNSQRSSFSFEIEVQSPSQPSTPREGDESSAQDGHYLSPNGSQTISLPRVQPQPQPQRIIQPQPHESPVLPVLPRIVPQPTVYGTPAVRAVDLSGGNPGNYTTPYYATGNEGGAVYEEAPTPPGFHYPTPLGAAVSGGRNSGAKAKGKSGSTSQSSTGAPSPYYASGPYAPKPDSSSASASSQAVIPSVIPAVIPKTPSSSSTSSTSSLQPVVPPPSSSTPSSSSQPVVPPVVPNVGGIYQNHSNRSRRNGGDDDDDGEENTSFDSDTKRNTQWNSRLSGKW